MWHKDLGWWAFWISLLALISAFPLSVLANLASPKIRNWWASRSRAALQKRIAVLESDLAHMQEGEPITNVESFMLSSVERLETSMGWWVYLIVSTVWF